MSLKLNLSIWTITLLMVSCGQPVQRKASPCTSCIETSAKASTVQTVSGPVAGYVEDGVYIYKGIPYGEAARFMPPTDPQPWKEVRASRSYGPVSPHGPRSGWRDDNQAFTMHWDDGWQMARTVPGLSGVEQFCGSAEGFLFCCRQADGIFRTAPFRASPPGAPV